MLDSLFNKVAGLQLSNFIKGRLQHRCFPANKAKFLRTPILKNICEWPLLLIVIFSQENNHMQRCLDLPEPKLHKKLTYVMLAHSPQTTFHRKIIYNFIWSIWAEAVTQRCSVKKVFLEILPNAQENTCARSLQSLRPATLLKKRLWHSCFLVNFVKFVRILFLTEHLRWLLLSVPALHKGLTCGMLVYG